MPDTQKSFWPSSIRWHLQLWLACLLVCMLTGFGLTVYQLQRVTLHRQLDADLETRVAALNQAVRDAPFTKSPVDRQKSPPGPPPTGLTKKARPAPVPQTPQPLELPPQTAALFDRTGYYFAVWYRDGTLLNQSPDAPPDLLAPAHTERDTLTHWRTRQGNREAFHCSGLSDCALVGRSLDADTLALRNFALTLMAAGAAILFLALSGGFWITNRAIRPVEKISAAAARISQGHLSERIDSSGSDNELGRLTAVLNSTFDRLESAFAREREFTADAAHELRTPLSVIITEIQSTLARERTGEVYREALETCLDTAQEMKRLCDSLHELARIGDDYCAMPLAPVDLAVVALPTTDRLFSVAAAHGITTHAALAPAEAMGNPEKIAEVIANLISNAIRYTRPNGEIRVTTSTDFRGAILTVEDTGIGIPEADLPQIFERFYRVDRSRTRVAGHTGLGLAICKAVVDAHHGSIEVISEVGVGTTVTVRLPPPH